MMRAFEWKGQAVVRAIVLGCMSATLAGCISKEQIAENSKKLVGRNTSNANLIVSRMREVQPHVSWAHLDECKRLWAAKGYIMEGTPQMHAQASCSVLLLGGTYATTKVAAAYMTTAKFQPLFGGLKHSLVGYVITLEGGKIFVTANAQWSAPQGNFCHTV